MTKKNPPNEPVALRIKLPVPVDIAGTLIKIIGLTWPKTRIADDGHTLKHERELVLHIDQADRHKSAKARKKYEDIKDHADPWVGSLGELGPNGISMSPHNMLVASWIQMASQSFDMFPDAENYLETVVYDSDRHQQYVFHVAKGKDRTPHALLKEAQSRIAELEAELAKKNGEHDESG